MSSSASARRIPARTRRRLLALGVAGVAAVAIVATVVAQSASGWDLSFSGTGGGGRSTGGAFVLTGHVGEPVVGHATGGSYIADSGLFGLLAETFKRVIPHVAADGVG